VAGSERRTPEFIADLFVSLDGFALGEGSGPYFGYGGPELDRWIRNHLDRPQLIIMGRGTYEALAPRSVPAADASADMMNRIPKAVVSNTLRPPLAWNNTRLITGDIAAEIRALKQQTGDPLRSIGSITLVKTMMQLELIDRLRLMVFPLVLGSAGREPIFAGYRETRLKLVSTEVLDSRLLAIEYAMR
jgi:dihydrofolate reductase